MTITKITDHAAQAVATQQNWAREKPRTAKLCEILGDEVQLLEDVAWQVLVNSLLENATGLILDEYGSIFDEPRGSLSDAEYKRVLSVIMGVHQSDGTTIETIYLTALLIDETIRYRQTGRAAYRMEYETDTPVSGDWQERIERILEILRPAGVEYALVEGNSSGNVLRLDTAGQGLDLGELGRRVNQ